MAPSGVIAHQRGRALQLIRAECSSNGCPKSVRRSPVLPCRGERPIGAHQMGVRRVFGGPRSTWQGRKTNRSPRQVVGVLVALGPPSLAQHVLFRYGKETSCRRSSMRRVMLSLTTPDTQTARSTWLAQSRQKVPSLSGKFSLYLCCEKVSLTVPRCERVTRRATTQGPISS